MSSEAAPAWSRLRHQPSKGWNLLFRADYLLPTSCHGPRLPRGGCSLPQRLASNLRSDQNDPYAGSPGMNRDACSFLRDFSPSGCRRARQPPTSLPSIFKRRPTSRPTLHHVPARGVDRQESKDQPVNRPTLAPAPGIRSGRGRSTSHLHDHAPCHSRCVGFGSAATKRKSEPAVVVRPPRVST